MIDLPEPPDPSPCVEGEKDCPFSYKEGEEPPEPEHAVLGTCVNCGNLAHTRDDSGDIYCFGCAYGACWD